MIGRFDAKHFEEVLRYVDAYFALEYHAGTREMIHRYVCRRMGYVEYKTITAALVILRDRGTIMWEKRVWWNVGA